MTHLIRSSEAVQHETPNAVMRTLAAPSTGAGELSVWEVRMRAGASGPVHSIDREQVWVVLDGELQFTLSGDPALAGPGDTVAVAGGAERRVHAPVDARAIVSSPAASIVSTPDGAVRPLPWAA